MADVNALRQAEHAGPPVDAEVLQWMFLAGVIRQVLHFGRRQERGHVELLLLESRINPSSVLMAFTYLARVLDTAPVDPHTRRGARALFQRLFERALDRVQVDTTTVVPPEERDGPERGGWVEDGDARRELSGNAADAVEMMRLLYPSVPEPVAIEHAMAVEAEVWAGRDRGTSLWAFAIRDEHEEDGTRELGDELKELWAWPHGGELTITAEAGGCEITLEVVADERVLMLDAPTGEMCFGRPLSSDAVSALVDELEFDPPDDDSDCYHMDLDIRRKDQNDKVVAFLFETLEVYGWDATDDLFGWECEFWMPEDEVEDEDEDG